MTNEELKKIREEKNQSKGELEPKKTTVLIQSQLGGTITPEEVLKRIPEGCDRVYIKPEENKAYWVKGVMPRNYILRKRISRAL